MVEVPMVAVLALPPQHGGRGVGWTTAVEAVGTGLGLPNVQDLEYVALTTLSQ